jgi:16S rRNA U1498 N3-methylase RsmE
MGLGWRDEAILLAVLIGSEGALRPRNAECSARYPTPYGCLGPCILRADTAAAGTRLLGAVLGDWR